MDEIKKNYKICVYAICKNEMQWIDRWLENMSEADYIVVLDTGSTDGSFEKLKKDPRVTKVKQKMINPWRFDVARNESLKLVPEDTDIFVCTDFDEFFEPKWADILRTYWTDEYDRCHYTYAWSHNDLGEPQDVFKYDKIHTKDYHWIFPVHEVLAPNDENKAETILDAGEHIYLHHLQDKSKERKFYFDLLKLSVEENPENSHCKMLLAREYLLREDYDNAIEQYEACLKYKDIHEQKNVLVLLETYGRLGDLYFIIKKDFGKALNYYLEFLKIDKTHREPYFCIAEIYNELGLFELAIAMVETGLKCSYQHYDWVERRDYWIAKANEILLVSYLFLEDYDNAIKNGKIAIAHKPNDINLLKQYNYVLEKKLLLLEKTEEEQQSDNKQ